jgi:hypothetical protein
MDISNEKASVNIINNLQILEQLTKDSGLALQDIPNIDTLLLETTEWTYETIMSEEIEIALQILDLLYYLDRVRPAKLEIHLRTRAQDPKNIVCHQLQHRLLLSNVSYFVTSLWEISSVSEFMNNSIDALVKHLGLPAFAAGPALRPTPQIAIFEENESSEDKVHRLRLLFQLVKCYLQAGAVNSQLMNHDKALHLVNTAKFYFKILIFNLELMIEVHRLAARHMEREHMDSSRSRASDENPYFAPQLDMPELKKFQSLGNNTFILDFLKFTKEVLQNDPTEVTKKNESKELSNVIFWKHNSSNNEKYFKKELASRSRDLGVSNRMATVALRDFNIGNVMHIKPISLSKLSEEMTFGEFFNVKFAVEVLLTYCCCLFSIATENRFLCQKETELEQKSNELKGGNNDSKKSLKIYKLQKNPNFIAS